MFQTKEKSGKCIVCQQNTKEDQGVQMILEIIRELSGNGLSLFLQ